MNLNFKFLSTLDREDYSNGWNHLPDWQKLAYCIVYGMVLEEKIIKLQSELDKFARVDNEP